MRTDRLTHWPGDWMGHFVFHKTDKFEPETKQTGNSCCSFISVQAIAVHGPGGTYTWTYKWSKSFVFHSLNILFLPQGRRMRMRYYAILINVSLVLCTWTKIKAFSIDLEYCVLRIGFEIKKNHRGLWKVWYPFPSRLPHPLSLCVFLCVFCLGAFIFLFVCPFACRSILLVCPWFCVCVFCMCGKCVLFSAWEYFTYTSTSMYLKLHIHQLNSFNRIYRCTVLVSDYELMQQKCVMSLKVKWKHLTD